jgi:hypothetical protein
MLVTRQQFRAHMMTLDDELRPAVGSVQIKPSGTTIATNGHIAVRVTPRRQPDEEQFPPIAGLEGHDPEQAVYREDADA